MLKKFIGILVGASILLSACDKNDIDSQNNIKNLKADFESILIDELNFLEKSSVYSKGELSLDYAIVYKLKDKNISSKKEYLEHNSYPQMFPIVVSSLFCNGSYPNNIVKEMLERHAKIQFAFTAFNNEILENVQIDKNYCKKNDLISSSEVKNNLRTDGRYTRRFLEKNLLPIMKDQIPNKINDEFEMTDISLGDKSSLILTIKYSPKVALSEEEAVDKSAEVLNRLYAQACTNVDTKELIKRLDSLKWVVVSKDNKVLSRIIASRTCS